MTGHWADLLRFVDFVLASVTIGAILRVLTRQYEQPMSRFQVARFWSLLVFVAAVFVTEVTRIHHPATWHTWVDLVGCLLGFYGVSGLLGFRRPPRDREL